MKTYSDNQLDLIALRLYWHQEHGEVIASKKLLRSILSRQPLPGIGAPEQEENEPQVTVGSPRLRS